MTDFDRADKPGSPFIDVEAVSSDDEDNDGDNDNVARTRLHSSKNKGEKIIETFDTLLDWI